MFRSVESDHDGLVHCEFFANVVNMQTTAKLSMEKGEKNCRMVCGQLPWGRGLGGACYSKSQARCAVPLQVLRVWRTLYSGGLYSAPPCAISV